jgi:hypothetical protein
VQPSEPDATVATVPVSPSFDSVQGLAPRTVAVGAGDTSGFSDDTPIHQSALLPHGEEALTTGAGTGSVAGPHHPNVGGLH